MGDIPSHWHAVDWQHIQSLPPFHNKHQPARRSNTDNGFSMPVRIINGLIEGFWGVVLISTGHQAKAGLHPSNAMDRYVPFIGFNSLLLCFETEKMGNSLVSK